VTSAHPVSRGVVSVAISIALLLAVGRPAPALAQGPTIEQQAVQHFENSKRLYQQGRLRESLVELRTAHRLVPDRDLLLNIAKIEDRLKLRREALASYREYLAQNPESAERSKIEVRITHLKAELDEEDRRNPPTVVRPTIVVQPTEAPPPGGLRRIGVLPFLVFAVGAGLLVGGLVLNKQAVDLAYQSRDPVKDPTGDLYVTAQHDYNTSIGLIVAGGVVTAAALTWGIVNLARSRPAASAAAPAMIVGGGPLPGGGSLVLQGRF
jgi:hypothetical protein